MDVDEFDTRDAFRKSGVSDFFPEDGDYRARSAILAEHVLGSLIAPEECLNGLAQLVERLVDFREADERYEQSIPKILRFAVITKIFHGSKRRQFISNLYDQITSVAYLRSDPQFWLQYAMARMEEREWISAQKLLETAYETAKRRVGYRTYMLDNQMARFYLDAALAGYFSDLDAVSGQVSELVNRRLSQSGNDIDIYVYRLVQPLVQFRDQMNLSKQSAHSLDTLINAMRERISEVKSVRTLDDEENRVWQLLSRR